MLTPVNDYNMRIQRLEQQQVISAGTAKSVGEFLEANETEQRETFDQSIKKKLAKAVLFGFFDIIANVKSDPGLVFYCLVQLDGILEDDRGRVEHFVALGKDYKAPQPVIKILNQYIHQNTDEESLPSRDIASHILALMIEHESFADCAQYAREFLHYLIQQNDPSKFTLSVNAYTFALLTILKTNDLAKEYSTKQNFMMLSNLLDTECLGSYQVSYNVLCMLWILSYHDFTQEFFEDYTIAIIEKVAKVMDYHSKEKIARIMLMLFDNLKDNEGCQDHLSEIDVLNLIIKLQNRHWVDEDIN